jgi:NADPH:quinone reductase-like Zn-dependent oxidoreductase
VADFNPLMDMPSGVQLSTFASAFVLGEEQFPIGDVPLQEIVEKAGRGVLQAKPARVFAFEEMVEAHRLMDSGQAGGKLVAEVA